MVGRPLHARCQAPFVHRRPSMPKQRPRADDHQRSRECGSMARRPSDAAACQQWPRQELEPALKRLSSAARLQFSLERLTLFPIHGFDPTASREMAAGSVPRDAHGPGALLECLIKTRTPASYLITGSIVRPLGAGCGRCRSGLATATHKPQSYSWATNTARDQNRVIEAQKRVTATSGFSCRHKPQRSQSLLA